MSVVEKEAVEKEAVEMEAVPKVQARNTAL
jgi:hypothetical protein